MTGQDLLDRMELLNAELQLQSGESNVARGLLALNVAQDHFESLAAAKRNILGSSIGTVSTAASTESTAFPSGLLRIDRLHLIGQNGRPEAELIKLQRTGGHAVHRFWPLSLVSTSSSGKPQAYWTNGSHIYWDPLPAGIYTVRWYGFSTAVDITTSGTFLYPDIVALPIASFAVRLIKGGLDDDPRELASIANETFRPVLDALSNFNRDGAMGLEYTEVHSE
jgi:hypothetical protein